MLALSVRYGFARKPAFATSSTPSLSARSHRNIAVPREYLQDGVGLALTKFGAPESTFANKKVCVTGLIKEYKSAPEVIAEQPSQIVIQK